MKIEDFNENLNKLKNTKPDELLAKLCEAFENIGIPCTVTDGELDIAILLPKELVDD